MSRAQWLDLQELVEGLVAGRLLEAGVPRKKVIELSHNAGAYTAGQVRELVKE